MSEPDTRLKYLTFSFLVHWTPVHFQLTQACTTLKRQKKKKIKTGTPAVCLYEIIHRLTRTETSHALLFFNSLHTYSIWIECVCVWIFFISFRFTVRILVFAFYYYDHYILYIFFFLFIFSKWWHFDFKCAHFRWYKLQRRILFIVNNNTDKFYLRRPFR